MYNAVLVKFTQSHSNKLYVYHIPKTTNDYTGHIALIQDRLGIVVAVEIAEMRQFKDIYNNPKIKPILEICKTKRKGGIQK